MTSSLYFDLGGATLCVEGPQQALELFEWLLAPRQIEVAPVLNPVFNIQVCEFQNLEDEIGLLLDEKQSFAGQTLRFYKSPNQVQAIRIGDNLQVELFADGSAKVSSTKLAAHLKGLDDLLLIALEHVISSSGQSFIHAACLAVPDASSAILLHAESGTGKTTTSFALSATGYGIISDDAAVIRCAENAKAATAWGVPRAPKVHMKTVEALPFLSDHFGTTEFDLNGERFLNRSSLISAKIFMDAKEMPVSAVVSLSRDLSKPCGVVKVGAFDGLHDLLEDNMSTIGAALRPYDENKLDIYSAMVRCIPCYRVNLNGTPIAMANMISHALGHTI